MHLFNTTLGDQCLFCGETVIKQHSLYDICYNKDHAFSNSFVTRISRKYLVTIYGFIKKK